jgi:hypothetical protein
LLSPNVEDYLTGEVARKLIHDEKVLGGPSDSRKDVERQ